MLWRASAERWVFASYVWNEEGTEAVLAPEDGVAGVAEVAPGKRHSIPSVADCRACHESRRVEPLGFNALQLSTDRDPNAIHGERLAPGMVTLQTLQDEHLLRPEHPELLASPPRIRAESPRARAVLGYLAANCGVCHNRDGDIPMLGPSLKHRDVVGDGDAVARAMVGHPTSWQVPGVPAGTSVAVNPEAPDLSAVLVRMRSRRPSSQMPPLGTVVADGEATEAIARWIGSDLAGAR
jgi:cytochrome c553